LAQKLVYHADFDLKNFQLIFIVNFIEVAHFIQFFYQLQLIGSLFLVIAIAVPDLVTIIIVDFIELFVYLLIIKFITDRDELQSFLLHF